MNYKNERGRPWWVRRDGCIFGSSTPSVPATPPPPAPVDNTNINTPQASTSVASAKSKQALAQGLNSTIATSGLGTANTPGVGTAQQATLGGGV